MTNEDYSKVPPPHLLKKFSEQAREGSNKRGRPGYCKTFAKLCIDWAFQEAAMDDLRISSAEASGVELNSKSSPNNLQIRSSDVAPLPKLVQQWFAAWESGDNEELSFADFVIPRAAQWGADTELEACCELLDNLGGNGEMIRRYRRPKSPTTLKRQALIALDDADLDAAHENILRRALKALPDD